jgi:hypothetical protein
MPADSSLGSPSSFSDNHYPRNSLSSQVSSHVPIPPSFSTFGNFSLNNVLSPRDIIGEGCLLQNERLRLVETGAPAVGGGDLAGKFEVIQQIDDFGFATVYEVCETSLGASSDKDHTYALASEGVLAYGRHYVIQCLSKANLDEDALSALMSEVSCPFYSAAHRLNVPLGGYPPVASATPLHCYASSCL